MPGVAVAGNRIHHRILLTVRAGSCTADKSESAQARYNHTRHRSESHLPVAYNSADSAADDPVSQVRYRSEVLAAVVEPAPPTIVALVEQSTPLVQKKLLPAIAPYWLSLQLVTHSSGLERVCLRQQLMQEQRLQRPLLCPPLTS